MIKLTKKMCSQKMKGTSGRQMTKKNSGWHTAKDMPGWKMVKLKSDQPSTKKMSGHKVEK